MEPTTMADAVYIDFEAPKTNVPSPAILGILSERGGKQHFEQIILDRRLERAAVASAQLSVATLAATVTHLTALDMRLVAWSEFDLRVVTESDLDPALKTAWRARYVNALATARTWRAKVHPAWRIARASEHDAKHTLDQYAALAGYDGLSRLKHAAPAKWIRHLQRQLAARTHYRRVTKQTKRDWHALLRYNEADCRALRHVYRLATQELDKWREYEQSDYVVFDARREVRFRVGGNSTRVAALLDRHAARRWAFMTAWNPGSQPLPRAENDERQNGLLARLLSAGYRVLQAEGRSTDSSWREESVFALDIPEPTARAFGRDFGQLAMVVGQRGGPARLVSCAVP
jgi:hypothetical protein